MSVQHSFVEEPKKFIKVLQDELEYETELSKIKVEEILWPSTIIMTLGHLGAVYAVYLRYEDTCVYTEIFMKFLLIIGHFGTIIGNHRLWSHRAFKAETSLQIVLAILTCLTFQHSSYHWAKNHRMHHKYSETNADPHNTKRGFFYAHVGWTLVKKQKDVINRGREMDYTDLENNAVVMFQHKYYPAFIAIIFFFVPTFIPWYFWGESLKRAFFICVIYKWIININVIFSINSFAHKFGYKPYNKRIVPTDYVLGHITTLGEGFHNFHHTFPSDYRVSEFSLDSRNATTIVIDLLHKLGLVYDLKATPKSVLNIWADKYGDHSNEINTYTDYFLSKVTQHFIIQLEYFFLIFLFFYFI